LNIVISVFVILYLFVGQPHALSFQGQAVGTPADQAMQQFHREVAAYLTLRAKLAEEIVPPLANSTAAQISSASDALSRAIERARPKPPLGVFFDPSAAEAIRTSIRALLAQPGFAAVLDGIDDEPQRVQSPGVYVRFPGSSQLATMPPSLLAVLPVLPPELEYRLIGENLILRDIAAALVLDVLPKAVPRP
jgi:hypothetical protein